MSKRIGIALGSGAARGIAHVGVLKALGEINLQPEYLSGASMGALIAATYAAGLSIEEIEDRVRFYSKKNLLMVFPPFLNKNGLLSSNRVRHFLRELLPVRTFEELIVPLTIVATDIETGEVVAFSEGELIPAIQASVSIPFLFSPVKIGGRYLVDGGLACPIPVAQLKEMGADFTIAVNVISRTHRLKKEPSMDITSTPQEVEFPATLSHNILGVLQRFLPGTDKEKEGLNLLNVLLNAYSIGRVRFTEYQLSVESPDVLLEPEIGKVAGLEFHRGPEIVQRAYNSVREQLELLEKSFK